jgi:hypothetical protein
VRQLAASLTPTLLIVTALALPGALAAGEPLGTTFGAPLERVWGAVLEVLEREGWGIDDTARPAGLITTKSQRLDGYYAPVASTTKRVRLRVQVTPLSPDRTRVDISRELFIREKVLFIERDEFVRGFDPLAAPDHQLERALLIAIGRAL